MLKELEKAVLSKSQDKLDVVLLSEKTGVPLSSLMSAVESLRERGLVGVDTQLSQSYSFTEEGLRLLARGLPERRLCDALGSKAESIVQLRDSLSKKSDVEGGLRAEEFGIALQWAKTAGMIKVEGGTLLPLPASHKKTQHELLLEKIREVKSFSENALHSDDKNALSDLERRKLVEKKIAKKISVKATPAGLAELEQEREGVISQLNPQLLRSGGWKGREFAPYEIASVLSTQSNVGKKHAYKQFILQIKQKLASMGFKEAHGPLVEMEFWNMDALFMAQDHPAREIHDVFQVEDPASGEILDKKLLEDVRTAHERGLAGSKGWHYKWDPEISARLVMRSHTTPVSARNLAKGLKPPQRIFCIGRVFRPDEIDWKHFIEFNQCEGIVVDESMSFRELLGYLKEFALEVFGANDVKFAPTYFPFTEPSVELMAEIPGKGWAEVGGAGMFRPEMLAALGVDVPVLAWGLGIDRLAMIKLGLTDIRDLFTQDLRKLKA